MNIEFTGRGTEVTEALKNFTIEKLNKLSRFTDNILDISVIFTVEKHRHIAEIKIKAGHEKIIAKETTNDMYLSIGGALDKVEKQAKKLKSKGTSKKRKATKQNEIEVNEVSTVNQRVIPVDAGTFRPITVDEALIEIEQDNKNFLIFRDSENGEVISILYVRDEETYGLITLE